MNKFKNGDYIKAKKGLWCGRIFSIADYNYLVNVITYSGGEPGHYVQNNYLKSTIDNECIIDEEYYNKETIKSLLGVK